MTTLCYSDLEKIKDFPELYEYVTKVEDAAKRIWPMLAHHMGRAGRDWNGLDRVTADKVRRIASAALFPSEQSKG